MAVGDLDTTVPTGDALETRAGDVLPVGGAPLRRPGRLETVA
jgi:hypothetical protein